MGNHLCNVDTLSVLSLGSKASTFVGGSLCGLLYVQPDLSQVVVLNAECFRYGVMVSGSRGNILVRRTLLRPR